MKEGTKEKRRELKDEVENRQSEREGREMERVKDEKNYSATIEGELARGWLQEGIISATVQCLLSSARALLMPLFANGTTTSQAHYFVAKMLPIEACNIFDTDVYIN